MYLDGIQRVYDKYVRPIGMRYNEILVCRRHWTQIQFRTRRSYNSGYSKLGYHRLCLEDTLSRHLIFTLLGDTLQKGQQAFIST